MEFILKFIFSSQGYKKPANKQFLVEKVFFLIIVFEITKNSNNYNRLFNSKILRNKVRGIIVKTTTTNLCQPCNYNN